MCGRYTLIASGEEIAARFRLPAAPDPPVRYNIAPSQPIVVVRHRPDETWEATLCRWGLLPFWAKDPKMGYRTINARAETVAKKPAYRAAFRARRCLIPATGFYEWQRRPGRKTKQPYYIHLSDQPIFAMAGLWERWTDPQSSEVVESAALITTDANARLAPIHDRMPAILKEADWAEWLDPGCADTERLQAMLAPYPPDRTEAYPVGTFVNNPKHDSPRCIEPVATPDPR
ncbi:MAG: SOS response-associated peptidase [Deltaproteobacteria bacterium]|nr:MAG: SOS response-associated peptidase [Deltaproteobacteria bacterium]